LPVVRRTDGHVVECGSNLGRADCASRSTQNLPSVLPESVNEQQPMIDFGSKRSKVKVVTER